jgi:sugar phosphate permease
MPEVTSPTRPIPRDRWFRLIPPMILVYVISYTDRMNISFAMAGGMNEALGISMTVSGLAAGIFFIGYLFLQIPGGHLAEHRSAKTLILWTIVGWGGVSILTAFVQNEWQLLLMRFLLGVSEGGLWPAMLVVISNWFPDKECGRANALFMSSIAIAAVLSSPLSGWLVGAFTWRGMFIVEGVASLALIAVWLPLIADKPQDAKWISKEERDYLVETINKERQEVKKAIKKNVSYKDLLGNINLWKMTLIYFAFQTGRLGFMLWLPTIIRNLTKTGIASVGLLATGPYIAALVGMYLFSAMSDKSRNRRKYTIVTAVGFALFFWLSTQVANEVLFSYLLLTGAGFFTLSMIPVFWAMIGCLFPAGYAGAARGFINAIGSLGGFVGPFLFGWVASTFGMNAGIYCLVGFLLAGAGICMTLPAVTAGIRDQKDRATEGPTCRT